MCPFKGTPQWVYTVIGLWARCSRWKCLPQAGALEDQDPFTMDCFDVIDDVVNSYHRERDAIDQSKLANKYGRGGRRR